MKIAICEFHQETNSINRTPSSRGDYEVFGIWQGQEMLDQGQGPTALGGMIDTLRQAGAEIVPTYRMWANAAGPVEASVVQEFLDAITPVLQASLPLDGVCVSLHGATQSTVSDDVCGDILAHIRSIVGPKTIVAASMDLHGNATERMQRSAQFLCGYHTYPHVDFYNTGCRAAGLCLRRIASGGRRPVMVRTAVPMILPASAYHTMDGPIAELMRYAQTLVDRGELLDYSIFQMQPWLDVPEGGSAVVTVSEEPRPDLAMDLARRLLALRHQVHADLKSVDEIIALAEENHTGRPIVLADSADSTNAGASGDSAYVLQKILERQSPVKAALYVSDVESALQAMEVGVGNTAVFHLGGKLSPELSSPVEVTARVCSLHDGEYTQEGPAKPGLVNHLGPTAVLAVGNTRIIVANYLLGPGDLQLYRHHGIEPTMYQLVAVKACTSFRVSYAPIADSILDADTPGAASANLLRLPFRKIPQSFYPFSEISEEQIPEPVCLS